MDPLNKEAATLLFNKPNEFEAKVKNTLKGGKFDSYQFTKFR